MDVIVTGATGLLGRSVVWTLAEAGVQVHGVGRGERPDLPLARWSRVDLTTPWAPLRDAERVVHLAACPKGPGAQTCAIDEAVGSALPAAAHFIYASGCSLYAPSEWPAGEDTPFRADLTGYLAAKAAGDRRALDRPRGCVLRISCPYGPGGGSSILARMVRAARAGQPLCYWGRGTREQDFVTARDVGRCVLAALDGGWTGPVNAARGAPTTMAELAATLSALTGVSAHQDPRPDPHEGARRRVCVARAAALGWHPLDDLRTGLAWTLEAG